MNLNEQVDFSVITQKTWTRDQFFKIFIYFNIFFISLFLAGVIVLGFDRITWPIADTIGNLTDFFDPIAQIRSYDTAYHNWLIMYPPLITLLIAFMSSFVPIELLNPIHAFALRDSYVGLTIFSVYTFIVFPIFIILLMQIKQGKVIDKIIWSILILLSRPFIYMFDRGNYMLLALIFMFLFMLFYNRNKLLHHLSIIFLAIAISIKIYPAALGILLLQDKKYKDILWLGFYCILFFAIPLIWLGGFDSIYLLIRNLKMNSLNTISRGYGYTHSLINTIKMIIYACTRQEFIIVNNFLPKLSILFFCIGSISSYFLKIRWKTVALLSLIMIMIPSISYVHTATLMILPLALFLNDKSKKVFKDFIYLFLFALMLCVNIPIFAPIFYPAGIFQLPVLMDNFCARLSMLVMFCMLCQEGINNCIIQMKLWKKK